MGLLASLQSICSWNGMEDDTAAVLKFLLFFCVCFLYTIKLSPLIFHHTKSLFKHCITLTEKQNGSISILKSFLLLPGVEENVNI